MHPEASHLELADRPLRPGPPERLRRPGRRPPLAPAAGDAHPGLEVLFAEVSPGDVRQRAMLGGERLAVGPAHALHQVEGVLGAILRDFPAFGQRGGDVQVGIKLDQWLVEVEDDDLAARLNLECGLHQEQIAAILKVALPPGYMSFSRLAIVKLIPVMEEGKLTSEAKKQVYGDRVHMPPGYFRVGGARIKFF